MNFLYYPCLRFPIIFVNSIFDMTVQKRASGVISGDRAGQSIQLCSFPQKLIRVNDVKYLTFIYLAELLTEFH